jgi:O-antigen/teichoic acid export membrane protein
LVSLALLPIFTRLFTPSEYGIIELLVTASALLTRILAVGVDSALLRFYNDYQVEERKGLVFTGLFYLAVVGVPISLVLSRFSDVFSRLLLGSDAHSTLVTLMLLTMPFIMIGWLPQDLTRLEFRKLKYNFLMTGGTVFYAIAAVGLVVFLHKGLWGVIFSHFLKASLFALLGIILVRHNLVPKVDFEKLKKLLSFGAPLLPAAIALWVSNSSDRFFLVRLASLHSVGVYSVANRLAWVQWFVFSSFQLAFTPIAYSIYRRPHTAVLFRRVFMYYIALSSVLGIGVSIFGLNLLRLLTPEAYHPAHRLVGLLSLSVILHGAFYIFGIGISIAEKTKYFAYSYLIGAAANIALNLVMIPRHGAMGAAVATVISFAIVALLGGYWSKRAYPLDFPFRKLILACLLFLIFNAIGVLIDTALGGSLLIKTLTVVVFAILMFLLLDRDDRSLLSKASTKLAGNRMKGFLWK